MDLVHEAQDPFSKSPGFLKGDGVTDAVQVLVPAAPHPRQLGCTLKAVTGWTGSRYLDIASSPYPYRRRIRSARLSHCGEGRNPTAMLRDAHFCSGNRFFDTPGSRSTFTLMSVTPELS